MLATKSTRVLQFAQESMRTLSLMYPETVEYFCVLRHDRVHALYSMTIDGSTKKHPWSAGGAPCYCTSTGRALLCDLDIYQLRDAYPNGLELAESPLSPIRTVAHFAAVLKDVRQDGYAAVDGELEPGLAGVAAPIREFGGRVVAAVNVSGVALPDSPRLRRARLTEVGQTTARWRADLGSPRVDEIHHELRVLTGGTNVPPFRNWVASRPSGPGAVNSAVSVHWPPGPGDRSARSRTYGGRWAWRKASIAPAGAAVAVSCTDRSGVRNCAG